MKNGELTCPYCEWVITSFERRGGVARGEGPADGDVMICYGCRRRAVVEGEGLRQETVSERAGFLRHAGLIAQQVEVMFRDEAALRELARMFNKARKQAGR